MRPILESMDSKNEFKFERIADKAALFTIFVVATKLDNLICVRVRIKSF